MVVEREVRAHPRRLLLAVALAIAAGATLAAQRGGLPPDQVAQRLSVERETGTSTERNIQLALRFCAVIDRQQFDEVEAMLSPGFQLYFSGQPLNKEQTMAMIRSVYGSFADFRHDVQETLAADDRVVIRFIDRATPATRSSRSKRKWTCWCWCSRLAHFPRRREGLHCSMARRRVLTLVAERKLSELIEPPKGAVLEASGVIAKDGWYYVVFDNVRRIARIHADLDPSSNAHAWFGGARDGEGYEDIAFSPHARRFYLLIEAEKHPDGTYKALVDECDENGRYKRRRWVDFLFDKRNTGFEGLSAVRWKECDYLLALCEGNRGRGGRKGKRPGGGRIQVLKRAGTVWRPVAEIALPPSVKFEDHSAVSLRGSQIAVISQQTSRLWVGTLKFGDWTIGEPGTIYDFPRTRKGNPKYCTLEGLCWLSPRSFVLVSDLSRRDHAKRCRKREQSIHVFRIPTRGAGLLSRRG